MLVASSHTQHAKPEGVIMTTPHTPHTYLTHTSYPIPQSPCGCKIHAKINSNHVDWLHEYKGERLTNLKSVDSSYAEGRGGCKAKVEWEEAGRSLGGSQSGGSNS